MNSFGFVAKLRNGCRRRTAVPGWRGKAGMALVAAVLLIGGAPPALAGYSKLAAGNCHSVALHNDGTVWTWGDNQYGQLGNGTAQSSTVPAPVPGLTDVISVGARENFTVALKADGTVWTWGENRDGQLGNGSYRESTVPVQVTGLADVKSIGVGWRHVMAVKGDGSLWGWGSNCFGELGIGMDTVDKATTPVRVPVTGIVDVAGGGRHTIALKDDGTVWCWGENGQGQLGGGVSSGAKPPVMVQGISEVRSVAAGLAQSYAVKTDGSLWSWGENTQGALGDGTRDDAAAPVRVEGLPRPVAGVAPGVYFAAALLDDGTVWSWGGNNTVNGNRGYSFTPQQYSPVFGVRAVASGLNFMLALQNDGNVAAWGENYAGQFGNGTVNYQIAPTRVTGVESISSVASCSLCYHTLALRSDGTVWSWGSSVNFTPLQIPGLAGVRQVAAGFSFGLALKDDGTVWAWGNNAEGQLGNAGSASSIEPVQVLGLSGVTRVAAGTDFAFALRSDGTVWGWGSNNALALGDRDLIQTGVPAKIPGLEGVIDVSAGNRHGMALKADGTVWLWGTHLYNGSGEWRPTQLQPLDPASGVAAGSGHSMIRLAGGKPPVAWGDNWYGQLCDGTTFTLPRRVVGSTLFKKEVAKIALGRWSTVALMKGGTVFSCGSNADGRLGTGDTTTPLMQPVQAAQLTDVVDIAAGEMHTVAVKSDGTVWGWGSNNKGQLGTDPGWSPVQAMVNLGPQEAAATLNVTVSGNGEGSVETLPPGFTCTTGTCTATFPHGTILTLQAKNGAGSVFTGWGGACSGANLNCFLAITTDTDVAATFGSSRLRIVGTDYATLAAAYAASTNNGSRIMSQGGDLMEGLLADRNVVVTLAGGYDADFTARSRPDTRLNGKLLLRRGTVKVDRIKVY